jgi:hypothetical protein
MPSRLETSDITCPPSTTVIAPLEIALTWPAGIVRRITVVIPDGHSGLTGIALGYGHTPILPSSPGAFLSGNDEVMSFEYLDDIPGVKWQAFVCNLDLQLHTWQVRFELDEIGDTTPAVPAQLVTPQDIMDAGTAILSGV